MVWANLLHIYQPPTQTPAILEAVANQSYRKLIQIFLAHPQAKITLNLPACLTELFLKYGYSDIVDQLKTLLARRQLELTSTSKYHAFLPKLPDSEIVRQISLNDDSHRRIFGDLYQPAGFFPPEMAYHHNLSSILVKLGFKWVILDEISLPSPVDYSQAYADSSGLIYFFRERNFSFKILSAQLGTADILMRELGDRLQSDNFLLTAMDGETFGHHRPGLEQLLEDVYHHSQIAPVTLSHLTDKYPRQIIRPPRPSTWATMPPDFDSHTPYSRWDDPQNAIHSLQWQLVNLALSSVKDTDTLARPLLDQALHSDQFWWASARPWWSLEMIEKGAHQLKTAVELSSAPYKTKNRAQKLYLQIITTGFTWQRDGTVENLSKKEDEDIKQHMFAQKAEITLADYDKLVDTLNRQMLQSAQIQEYGRADMLKKRIAELTADRSRLEATKPLQN